MSSDDSSSYGLRTSELTNVLFNSQHNTIRARIVQTIPEPMYSIITFQCGVWRPLFVFWPSSCRRCIGCPSVYSV